MFEPGSGLGVSNEDFVYRVRMVSCVPALVLLVASLPLHPLLLGWLLGTALAAFILAKCWLEIGRNLSLLTHAKPAKSKRMYPFRGTRFMDNEDLRQNGHGAWYF